MLDSSVKVEDPDAAIAPPFPPVQYLKVVSETVISELNTKMQPPLFSLEPLLSVTPDMVTEALVCR